MTGVVEHLHLGTGLERRVAGLADAEHDPAVAARGDLPLDRQLEVGELIDRDDVAAAGHARERAVYDLPASGHGRLLEPAPAGRRPAVEEQPPSGRALGRRERVRAL